MNKNLKATLPGKIIFSEAVLITVLFHAALIFLFTYAPVTTSTKDRQDQKFVMLNFSGERNPELDGMAKWLEYHDPSLIARPNSRYGYDILCRKPEFRRPVPDTPGRENSAIHAGTIKFNPLAPEPALKNNSYSRMIDYQPVQLPKPRKAAAGNVAGKIRAFPMAVSDGNELKTFFPNGVPSGLQDLTQTANPSRVEIRFQEGDMMPRINIEESSGSPRLDSAAVKEVIANSEQLKRNAPGQESVKVIVIWRKPEVTL